MLKGIKVVMKEWAKSKKACMVLAGYLLFNLVYTLVDARLIVAIGDVIADGAAWQRIVLLIGGMCLARSLAGIAETWCQKRSTYVCFNNASNRFGTKVGRVDYDLFTIMSVAKINTTAEFLGSITGVMKGLIRSTVHVIQIIVAVGTMCALGGKMIIPAVSVYAVGGLLCRYLYKKYDEIEKAIKEVWKNRNQHIENMINGFVEIRTFNVADREIEKLYEMNQKTLDAYNRKLAWGNWTIGTIEVMDSVGLIGVIAYTIDLMSKGGISEASALALVLLVFKIIQPLMSIIDFADELSDKLKLADDYDQLMSYQNHTNHNGTINLDEINEGITVENVHFSYPQSSSEVLTGVNITIPKGKKIGICGKTGDGKSTVLKLLNGFYDPDRGAIKIDGIDIRDINPDSYHRKVGAVHQENKIFPGTIMDNVRYARPDCTEHEVIEAARKAKLYDEVMKMQDRWETYVGPNGYKLSGGQKQRIALARLFLQNPEVIILDEATSALDNTTETFVQDAIDSLDGRTIITVAHRLSTIANCDIIYVMDGGKVAESGTHDELIALGGIYASMQK